MLTDNRVLMIIVMIVDECMYCSIVVCVWSSLVRDETEGRPVLVPLGTRGLCNVMISNSVAFHPKSNN